MGAAAVVCYKPKPHFVTREDILKALKDKLLKETISPTLEVSLNCELTKEQLSSAPGMISQDNTKATTQVKTEERNTKQRVVRGGNLTPHLQMETVGDGGANNNNFVQLNKSQVLGATGGIKSNFLMSGLLKLDQFQSSQKLGEIQQIIEPQIMTDEDLKTLQIKILGYFAPRELVYDTLSQLSRTSLFFMRNNHEKIERIVGTHQIERGRLILANSIEEHKSGVNQIVKLSSREVVTASDDCYIKYWSLVNAPPPKNSNVHHHHSSISTTLKADLSIPTETITCLAATGGNVIKGFGTLKKEFLLAGCHSGNLIIIQNSSVKAGIQPSQVRKEQIEQAHYNLIRMIVSLETLKNQYFATADVCGIVKVWSSRYKPQQLIEIDLEQAMSYNSLIELQNVLPQKDPEFSDSAMIACALKSQKIHLIVVMPGCQQYQKIRTISTDSTKPTCIIQLSSRHIAVAVGSLREPAKIEIHTINTTSNSSNSLVSVLSHHTDMIDSLIKISFPRTSENQQQSSSYVQWLVSASRDRKLTLWKLYDGLPMRRSQFNLTKSQRKSFGGATPHSSHLLSGRISAEDYLRDRSFINYRKNHNTSQAAVGNGAVDSSSGMQTPLLNQNAYDDDETPLVNKNNSTMKKKASENKKMAAVVKKRQVEENKEALEESSEYDQEYESEEDSQVREVMEQANHVQYEDRSPMLDYFYSLDSGHKDFVRSMIQAESNKTLITASEDKTIKLFNITSSAL